MKTRKRSRYAPFALALAIAAVAATLGVGTASSAVLPISQGRIADPVIVRGAAVPSLANIPVGDIVAFRWSTRWVHIPMQVDQRKQVELNTIYGQPANTTNPVNVVVYADAKTYAGAGSGRLGALDEIAFMARDTSPSLPPAFSEPAGVVHNSGVRIKAVDPLTGGVGYAFLYRRATTTLLPGAGAHYVTYTFGLLSGGYKATYKFTAGPNPENTFVTTPSYQRHFSDRWLDNQVIIKAGASTRVDIDDRHKALFAPGNCGRSEDTFDSGEGAFIANISGPVRAIRSYIGANSGPYTERTHIFYDRREDIVTDLRVHLIGAIMDFWDYSPAASGMRYTNDHNLVGATIDGLPDTVAAGAPLWEKVDGPQGALTHVNRLVTTISPLTATNYYYDEKTVPNPVTQCTGDQFSYGSSGTWVTSGLTNTDPHLGAAKPFQGRNTLFFEPPGRPVTTAQNHSRQMDSPLTLTVSRFTG